MTHGMTLFNPMNIMTNEAFTWRNEVKPTQDPGGRLCTFVSIEDGIRAGAIDLLSYYLNDGCKSIQTIISRYAPDVENPTANYILFVANHCDVSPSALVDITDKTFLKNLCNAICCFEQGYECVTDAQLETGVTNALVYKQLPA